MRKFIFQAFVIVVVTAGIFSCSPSSLVRHESSKVKEALSHNEIKKITVFSAGDYGIDSYRIPSLISATDGSLLLFAEGRKESSVDKSPTDIVLRRSSDGGTTWSSMQRLVLGGEGAFMDPTAIIDGYTGKIFLFVAYWPHDDHSHKKNSAWLLVSEDHGKNWTEPREITKIVTGGQYYINGFGPGSGIQMKGSRFKGRLVMPVRLFDGERYENRAMYSDNHGETWELGNSTNTGNEFMIAESPDNVLVYNLRAGKGKRLVSRSHDGGISWLPATMDLDLHTSVDYGGVEGSLLADGRILFFAAPVGGLGSAQQEDRQNLLLYRSLDGGIHWDKRVLLYNKAAGYTSMTRLKGGEMALVLETADTESFPKLIPELRTPGWMRLDVMILPEEIFNPQIWFQP